MAYDDTALIAKIEALRERTPTLSVRQAIIQVAGEHNLRRLQAKMARRTSAAASEEGLARIEIGASETENLLLVIERQSLAGSGESKEWAAFTNLDEIDRRRAHLVYPDYDERMAAELRAAGEWARLGALTFVTNAVIMCILMPVGKAVLGLPNFDELVRAHLPHVHPFMAAFVLLVGPAVTCLFRATWSLDNRRNMRKRVDAVQPRDPRRTERFVLTDAALYLIGLRDGAAEVRRIPRKAITSATLLEHGDVAVGTPGAPVVMKAPRQTAELLGVLPPSSNHGTAAAPTAVPA